MTTQYHRIRPTCKCGHTKDDHAIKTIFKKQRCRHFGCKCEQYTQDQERMEKEFKKLMAELGRN